MPLKGIVYGYTTKIKRNKDGKKLETPEQIMMEYKGKKVPAAKVSWITRREKANIDLVPIYTKGKKKGMPKLKLRGVLTDFTKKHAPNFEEAISMQKRYKSGLKGLLNEKHVIRNKIIEDLKAKILKL